MSLRAPLLLLVSVSPSLPSQNMTEDRVKIYADICVIAAEHRLRKIAFKEIGS